MEERSHVGLILVSGQQKKVCLLVAVVVVVFIIVQMQSQKTSKTINAQESFVNDRRSSIKTSEGEEFDSYRRVNGTWFNFSTIDFRLYAYSAFYDDRPSLRSLPVIRIIAISDRYEELKKRNVAYLHCVLHHDTKIAMVEMKEKPKPIDHGWILNKLNATEYIYTCPTIEGIVPSSVSITINKTQNFFEGVPVTVPKKPEKKRDFCVCVKVTFGKLDPHRIIEWLELQKILGVSLVGVYILSTSESVLDVFKHYSDEKFVDLRKTDYIYTDRKNAKEYKLQETSTINDCMYRNMYAFKRIIVIDFDEFIMPRKHRNLLELVTHLDETALSDNSPHTNLVFRNNFFFMDFPTDMEKYSTYLTFLRFRNKIAVSPKGYTIKSIVNPQACVRMHNHYCWGVTRNYTYTGYSDSVDPEIAVNQHYKKCHFGSKQCEILLKNMTQDDIMLRFEEVLMRNVKEKVKQIMGHDI